MEDVRAVTVDQDAIVVVVIVGIAADVAAPVDDQHALARVACQPLGQHAARKARPDYKKIKHCRQPFWG